MVGRRITLCVMVASGFLAGCDRSATEPNTPASIATMQARGVGLLRDVPAVRMGLPQEARAWDTSSVALEQAIASQDGHAIVAIKERGANRTLSNGRREAVAASTLNGALRMLEAHGADVLQYYWLIGAAHVRMPEGLATDLLGHPLIDYIEPRQWSQLEAVSGTAAAAPALLSQTMTWGIDMVRAPEAWTVGTGTGAVVRIIDTGYDRGHEDLPVLPLANCAGAFDGCNDGPISHGSHVMGILLARNNAAGVVGVAPGVLAGDVYSCAACSPYTITCSATEIVAGIQGSVGADVLNMSFGSATYDAPIANAVAQAWAAGVVIVASAGNRQSTAAPPSVFYPAGFPNVIGVSGVREDGLFASSSPCPHKAGGSWASNYGSYVDISAPFWALSTVDGNGYEDEVQGWCGTSMASPHVAGAAAILRGMHPNWTNQQIVDQLLSTAYLGGYDGRTDQLGHGVLDVAAAAGLPAQDPLVVTINGPNRIDRAGYYTWTAGATGGNGSYSYMWERRPATGGVWQQVGVSQQYSPYIDSGANPGVELRLSVTSGTETGVRTRTVMVSIL